MASGPLANKWGNDRNSDRLYFAWIQKSLQTMTAAMKLKKKKKNNNNKKKTLLPGIKPMTNLDSILKSRDTILMTKFHISSVQSLSCVLLFVTPWTAGCQTSLFINNSWSLLKLMPFESAVPSNHLILCHPPSPPAFNLSQHQGLF